jgi:hypothetical protein
MCSQVIIIIIIIICATTHDLLIFQHATHLQRSIIIFEMQPQNYQILHTCHSFKAVAGFAKLNCKLLQQFLKLCNHAKYVDKKQKLLKRLLMMMIMIPPPPKTLYSSDHCADHLSAY